MGNPTSEEHIASQDEVSEKALGWSVGGARRDLNPFTARDADGDMRVLEDIQTINFGRGVPDPTPGGEVVSGLNASGEMAEDRMGRLKRMVSRLTPSTRSRVEEAEPKPKEVVPKLVDDKRSYWNRTPYGGDESVIAHQADETDYHRFLASQGRWKEIHNDHYDWWMFPIDRGSAAYGDFYNVAGEPLERLKKNIRFMDSLAEAVEIQARANGWSLYEKDFIKDPDWDGGQDWTNAYPTRIWKMARSAQIFGLGEEFESLKLMQRSLEASGIRFNHRKYWANPGTIDEIPPLDDAEESFSYSPKEPKESSVPSVLPYAQDASPKPSIEMDVGDSVWEAYDNYDSPTDPTLMRAEELGRLLDDRSGSEDPSFPYLHIPRDDRTDISDTIFFGVSLLPASQGDGLDVDRAETADALEKIIGEYDLYEDDRYAIETLAEVLRDPDLLEDSGGAGYMTDNGDSEPSTVGERIDAEVSELIQALRVVPGESGTIDPYASMPRDERLSMADSLEMALSLFPARDDDNKSERRSAMADKLSSDSVWRGVYSNDSRTIRNLASLLRDPSRYEDRIIGSEGSTKNDLPILSRRSERNMVRAFTPQDQNTGSSDMRTYFISPKTGRDDLTMEQVSGIFDAARSAGLGAYKARGHKVPKILGPVFYEFAEPMVGRDVVERAVQATFPTYEELVDIGALNTIGVGRAAIIAGVDDGNLALKSIERGIPLREGEQPVFTARTSPQMAHSDVGRTANFLLLTASLIPGVDLDKVKAGKEFHDRTDFDNEYFSSIRFNDSHPLVSYARENIKKHRQYEEDYKDWAQRWASSLYDMMRRSGMSGSEIADSVHTRWPGRGYLLDSEKSYADKKPSNYLAHMADLMFTTLGNFYVPVYSDPIDDTGLLLPMHEFFHSHLGQGITRHGEYAAFRGPWEVYDSWSIGFATGWAANRRFAYRVLGEEASLRGIEKTPKDVFKMVKTDIENRLKQMLGEEQEIRKVSFLFPEYQTASPAERERMRSLVMKQLEGDDGSSIPNEVEVMPRYMIISEVDGFSPPKSSFPFGGEDRLGKRLTYVDKTGKQGRIQ